MRLKFLLSRFAPAGRRPAPLIAFAVACALGCTSVHAQTPAAPTPTTPPEGIRPPLPEPAPLPRFAPAPPPPQIAPAAPLAAPAASPGVPRPRPQAKEYCADPAHRKLTICRSKDAG
jgi:hypothetical protein